MKEKIAIILGSKSDLKQCILGLKHLKRHPEFEVEIYIRSQHRNTLSLQKLLVELSEQGVKTIIAGAGWANHLTGCTDAFLRYELKNDFTRVIGVAFEDKNNEKHTQAAILSITEVPGTQVIFQDGDVFFIGTMGFFHACELATSKKDNLPAIKIPEPKPAENLSLDEAMELAK